MLIDPGTAAPVRAGDDEVEHLAIEEQQVLDRGEELAHALAGERRDADRFARPRRLPAALLLANEIDLVRDLENRMGGPIEPELGEDLLDVLALRLALRMGGVAHMHDEIGVEHVLERRAERGDQRSREVRNEADGIDEIEAFAMRKADQDYYAAFTDAQELRKDGPTAAETLAMIAKFLDQSVDTVKLGLPYIDREGRVDMDAVQTQIDWYRGIGAIKGEMQASTVVDSRYAQILPAKH